MVYSVVVTVMELYHLLLLMVSYLVYFLSTTGGISRVTTFNSTQFPRDMTLYAQPSTYFTWSAQPLITCMWSAYGLNPQTRGRMRQVALKHRGENPVHTRELRTPGVN